jgi:hypothetical protein
MSFLEHVDSIHQEAMGLAEEAYLAQRRGDHFSARELYRKAFTLEARAADILSGCLDLEPTRSILHRSAATLAVRCGELLAAERLAIRGLSGKLPEEIADELREVLAEIEESRHTQRTDPNPEPREGASMSDKLFFNGVVPNGRYITPPITADELMRRVGEVGLDVTPEWVLDAVREHPKGDSKRPSIQQIQRNWDLSETGWAVVFAPGIDPHVKNALEELLSFRESQAIRGGKNYFRSVEYRTGEEVSEFLRRPDVAGGHRGDPDLFPYYVLLVGDPESIPYSFQQELDVGYAVGRICFDRPEDYAAYARSVVNAETRRPSRPRHVGFFGTAHENDPATQDMLQGLVEPLSESVVIPGSGWEVRSAFGPEARKERLRQLLGGAETPALLFAGCHGVGFEEGDTRQRDTQGALVCQDWPGPKDEEGVDDDQWFAAVDVPDDASLQGLIAFFVACYGVGTPARDNFDQEAPGRTKRIAPKPFASRLPQRLLSHPEGGALAVVGHVDRAWATSFAGSTKGEGWAPFRNTMTSLLQGYTLGWAIEDLNTMYASLAAQLGNLWEAWQQRDKEIAPELFSGIWLARNDARNYTIFGDPAVRLPGVGEPR